MVIFTKYDMAQTVFLKTDPEQHERIVTDIGIITEDIVQYELSLGAYKSWHRDFEIESEIDLAKKLKD